MIGLGQLEEALATSEQYNVLLKEEVATKLIPPASDAPHLKKER